MKKLLAVMLLMFSLPSFAGVSGDVGVYSDYFFRGESQSMGDRAFQGNLNLDYKGLYGNVWVGEVDGIEDANYRYDLTAGYRLDINDKWYVDGGVVQYRYDDKAIDHITRAIKTSNTRHDFSLQKSGLSNLAPKPKLKKKTKLATTAPTENSNGSLL